MSVESDALPVYGIGGLLYDGLSLKYEGWGFYEGDLFFVAAAAMFISIVPMLWVPEGGIKHEMETPCCSERPWRWCR